jgi:hypothetical protein
VPFVSPRSKRVTKNVKPIDPQLLKDVDAMAAPYREAMMGLDAVVREAARRIGDGADALATFQTLLSDAVVQHLSAQIPSATGVMSRQAFRAAVRAIKDLPTGLSIAMSFDKSDPRAIAWARLRAGKMIVQIQDEQLQAIRQIISNAIANGVTVPQAAKQIEQVVGLHDRWQRAVNNAYERDVQRFIAEGVNSERAVTMAQQNAAKYRQKLIRARARNIARTEVMAAQNQGTLLSWLQAGEKGLINLSLTKKEWMAGPSGWKGINVCDFCAPLNGQQVPVTAPFDNGLLAPPAHPSCRCRMILVPPEV